MRKASPRETRLMRKANLRLRRLKETQIDQIDKKSQSKALWEGDQIDEKSQSKAREIVGMNLRLCGRETRFMRKANLRPGRLLDLSHIGKNQVLGYKCERKHSKRQDESIASPLHTSRHFVLNSVEPNPKKQ